MAKAVKTQSTQPKETVGIYELWNTPEYGYVVLPQCKGRELTSGMLLRQGRLSRKANLIYIGSQLFAKMKGRMPKVTIELKSEGNKSKLDLSLREVLLQEGIL